jgi:hypothetical protein
MVFAVLAADIRTEIRLSARGSPLNNLVMSMVDVKVQMVGSCGPMVVAKADKAGLPTHNLAMSVNAHFTSDNDSVL